MLGDKEVGIALCSLSNLIKRYIDNDVTRQKVERITGNNSWIIGYLADNSDHDVYQKELEQVFGITKSTISRVLDLMEEKELIIRENVKGDKRLRKLVLTKKALDVKNLMDEGGKEFEGKLTKDFTAEEINQLMSYINRMKANISEKQPFI